MLNSNGAEGTERKLRKPNARELTYLKYQSDHNKEGLTWRQFYEKIYGACHWMTSSVYAGDWLDKKMGEFIG